MPFLNHRIIAFVSDSKYVWRPLSQMKFAVLGHNFRQVVAMNLPVWIDSCQDRANICLKHAKKVCNGGPTKNQSCISNFMGHKNL